MAVFDRDGISINYEILGDSGPWIVLTPGGRGGLEGVRALGEQLAGDGHRVLLHDRRNCGKSDVYIAGELSEQEVWADDVYALLQSLDALPAIAGGGSSGCRLSLLMALRHPDAVSGLLLWYVTGGQHAATALGQNYYGQYVELAREGGMKAVCESDFFAERIRENPENSEALMAMDPADFIATMSMWQDFFTAGADLPVIGATAEELRSIDVPTCIVPGADEIHPREVAVGLDDLLPDSELHYPWARAELEEARGLSPEARAVQFQMRMNNIFRTFLLEREFRESA